MDKLKKIWNPICINDDLNQAREFGHSSMGYLIPCCWCDPIFYQGSKNQRMGLDELQQNLFTDDMKISNNDNIEDILLSDPWQKWYDAISKGPEEAPTICKNYCYRSESVEYKIQIND
jgi:hypothetical protein